LHDVLGLGVVTDYPARDPYQARSFGLEHVRLVHGATPSAQLVTPLTPEQGRV
jgi:hypothetical protein